MASRSNNTWVPASLETMEPRFMSTDIRLQQKGGWNPAPKRKIQVDHQAAPQAQPQRNWLGLGYHQPAKGLWPSSGPDAGLGPPGQVEGASPPLPGGNGPAGTTVSSR